MLSSTSHPRFKMRSLVSPMEKLSPTAATRMSRESLQFNRADDVQLNGSSRVTLSIVMRYRVFKQRGVAVRPWKVSTTSWAYTLNKHDGTTVAEVHWRPRLTPNIQFPHLHAPTLDGIRRHLPTGRVLIEDVLMLAVECGAEPFDDAKWQQTHARNMENSAQGATWGVRRSRLAAS